MIDYMYDDVYIGYMFREFCIYCIYVYL